MEVETKADIDFYSHLISSLGATEADIVAPEIFAQDLSWMSWEARCDKTPKAFFYKIINVNGEVRLVNQRDLFSSEDILKKINNETRRGLEYFQMSLVKQRLLAAENGATLSWISPKKMLPEDPDYPLDQINIAKKIDEETVWVKQLQGDFVKLRPNQTLEELMLTIGDTEIFNFQFSPPEGGRVIFNEFSISNEVNKGREYMEAIKQGLSADSLRVKRAELLRGTIEYSLSGSILTSCGLLDFSAIGGPAYGWGSRAIMIEVKSKNWCSGCQIENTCTLNCYKCGGSLSSKPVSYI